MRSFPFDSDVTYDELGNPEYDRGADSTILASFIHLMFTDGVFPNPSTGLQVTASSETMSVIVLPGNCMIQGRMGIEETNRTLIFEASGTSYDRIDSVVARLNTNHDYRDVDLYVVKGAEASSPTPPELTRTGGVYELRLANVFIAKNTTVISTERITDTRLNEEDCGIVTSNPNPVDTATIFNQYQAALDQYLQYVKECIDGTTAGNLQKEIDAIANSIGVADISSIGDGTLTGGLKSLNTDLAKTNANLNKKSPTNHASTGTDYGVASTTEYGHVKLCHDYALMDNSKPPIPQVPSQKSINSLYLKMLDLLQGKQEKVVAQNLTATTTGNWVIVEKAGYHLVNAYMVRDDGSYPVSAIMKRTEGDKYTIFINGANNANVLLRLIWLKG